MLSADVLMPPGRCIQWTKGAPSASVSDVNFGVLLNAELYACLPSRAIWLLTGRVLEVYGKEAAGYREPRSPPLMPSTD